MGRGDASARPWLGINDPIAPTRLASRGTRWQAEEIGRNGAPHPVKTQRAAAVSLGVTVLNALLLATLLLVSIEPVRSTFGSATGLWHGCLPLREAGDTESWSPWIILLAGLPAFVGMWVSRRLREAPDPLRSVALVLSGVLLLLAVGLVVFPSVLCGE
jgi:hypothetical protein